MADVVDKATRSRMMSGIRGRNTKPEILVRQFLHGCGLRFRLHDRKLPGCPDIVLAKYGTVVFIHGCFWHHHRGCRFAVMPKSNATFWRNKLFGNVERDSINAKRLRAAGWKTLTIWECNVNEKSLLQLVRVIKGDPNVRWNR